MVQSSVKWIVHQEHQLGVPGEEVVFMHSRACPLLDLSFGARVFSTDVASGKSDNSGCSCIKYDCGCCLQADIPAIRLNDTVCVNVSYLPAQYGVSLTCDIDGYVIINETVSAKNPPPICVGVPYLEKEASVCVDLHDLDLVNNTFHSCVRLEARLYHVFVESVELGCFNIPLNKTGKYLRFASHDTAWLEAMRLMRKKKIIFGVK